MRIWVRNLIKENKFLNHALKNQEVESKEFDKIAKETNLKLKNVVFTCSQGDEVFEKFAPKFFVMRV